LKLSEGNDELGKISLAQKLGKNKYCSLRLHLKNDHLPRRKIRISSQKKGFVAPNEDGELTKIQMTEL